MDNGSESLTIGAFAKAAGVNLTQDSERTVTDKAAIVDHLKKSFAYTRAAVMEVPESEFGTAVDLFGQPADYDRIEPFCAQEGLWLLCDAAQSFGATYKGRKVGGIGVATTTSFFPAKPLGCYGDGGAVLTDDDELADIMRSLRVHGEGRDKYDCVRIGINGRLDTIQAAVLIEKLRIFPEEIAARERIARRYSAELAEVATIPRLARGSASSAVPARCACPRTAPASSTPTASRTPSRARRRATRRSSTPSASRTPRSTGST